MKFSDILYGSIEIPDWLIPFIKAPEFVRLRGIRLSNVDSFEFKDFNAPTRWEHCIGVAYLAVLCAKKRRLNAPDTVHLVLASLLHDIATPPFAHTIEYIFEDYDHEKESYNILSNFQNDVSSPSFPIYASQTPQFTSLVRKLSKQHRLKIDPDVVAELITGGGDLGFLINGSIDLDNIDNVSRACTYMGLNIDKSIPLKTSEWLAQQDQMPTKEEFKNNSYVQEWLRYKNLMYDKFYNSSDEEIGRQAFLQHLIRRAYNEGMSRKSIIWSTDESLLSSIEQYNCRYREEKAKYQSTTLEELVQRYRLLEKAEKIIDIEINDQSAFSSIRNPRFANWLENSLATATFEPFVIVNAKRFNKDNTLFQKAGGNIKIFKLGKAPLKYGQMPESIKGNKPNEKAIQQRDLKIFMHQLISANLDNKPWMKLDQRRKDNIKSNLDSVGNWSFRQSRNESMHSYPATFVHTIPATLITTLGLKNETIYDPFGGTGQTAMEAVKLGCEVYSSDSNTISNLISNVKFSYLTTRERSEIKGINVLDIISDISEYNVPHFDKIEKWHHPKTIIELSKILKFIESLNNPKLKNFFTLCFSEILTSCTNRRGKEHGYFADNTPLSKSEVAPSYTNAAKLLNDRAKININLIEKSYAFFERHGREVEDEFSKIHIFKHNILAPLDGILECKSISGIITSPPYLCMADYTLGQRLSYEWLFPELIREDFENEIAPRRKRSFKIDMRQNYLDSMRVFAKQSYKVLSDQGFLATVVGAPLANAYKDKNILNTIDEIFAEEGLNLFWETKRPINWHRNHGYARLKDERIAIYTKL